MATRDSIFGRIFSFLVPERRKKSAAYEDRTTVRVYPRTNEDRTLEVRYTRTRQTSANKQELLDNKVIAWDKSHPVNGRMEILRTQIVRKMEANGWRTLAVISPTPGAGKSFVATNLAISLAQNPNKSVMLVDLDLRRPQIAAKLGLPAGQSLLDYLSGAAQLSDVLVNPGVPRLVVAPVFDSIANSSELLSSRQVVKMIQEMRERYESRIVIFDLPPLLLADDALVVLPHVDCALLVLGDGEHSAAEIEDSLRLLHDVNLVGMVVNRSRAFEKVEGY